MLNLSVPFGLLAILAGFLFTGETSVYGLYGCFLFTLAAAFTAAVRGELTTGPAWKLAAAYAALMLLALAFGTLSSNYRSMSVALGLVYGALPAGLLLAFFFGQTGANILKSVGVPAAVGIAVCTVGYAIGFGQKGSLFEDSNTYATVLNIVFILTLWAREAYRANKAAVYLATASAVVTLGGLYFAQSKGAWLSLLGTLAFVLVAGRQALGVTRRHWAALLVMAAIAAASVGNRVSTETSEQRGGQSTGSRMAMLTATLDIIKKHPAGVGIGRWGSEYSQVRTTQDVESAGSHAHNDYLEVMAEAGPLGLFALGVPGVLALWMGLRLRRRPAGADVKWEAALVGITLVCALQAAVNFTFHFVSLNLMVGLACGLLLRAHGPMTGIALQRSHKVALSAAFAALVGVSGLAFVSYAAPVVQSSPTSVLANALPWLKEERAILALQKMNPVEPRLGVAYALYHGNRLADASLPQGERAASYYKARATWLQLAQDIPDEAMILGTAGGMVKNFGPEFDPNYLALSHLLLKRAYELAPSEAVVAVWYAQVLFKEHKFDEAERVVSRALERQPTMLRPVLQAALDAIRKDRKQYE